MATPKRIWFEGALYHITTRGNNKECIFLGEKDYEEYLKILEEATDYYKEYKYEIICYCLMSNHVHLMIKANYKPLSAVMRRINSRYAKYFNDKYGYVGHLFQSRYYSEIIKDDVQLLVASRYVHLNPVKANIVKKPEEYKKSSYSMLIGEEEPKLINPDILWRYFHNDDKHQRYKSFVELK